MKFMNMYKCPKCNAEFELGTKFCQNCGCSLEKEFIETPTCPKCRKVFAIGTKFCREDGSKLVSPIKLIPRCVKCGKEYTDGTKFCSEDGNPVTSEILQDKKRTSIIGKIDFKKSAYGKIVLVVAIMAAVVDIYIFLHYFSFSGTNLIGGFSNAFPLYLKHEVMGWIIFAVILSGIVKFVGEVICETDDKISETGSLIASFAGGLAVVFLIVGLLSRVITGY